MDPQKVKHFLQRVKCNQGKVLMFLKEHQNGLSPSGFKVNPPFGESSKQNAASQRGACLGS